MKIFIKLTVLLVLATLTCPCELTGHQFCDHKNHVALNSREDIRQWRTKVQPLPGPNISQDSLNTISESEGL